MKILSVVGWDNGFNTEKITLGFNNEEGELKIKQTLFPSIALNPQKSYFEVDSYSNNFNKEKMVVEYKGKEYFIGELAIQNAVKGFKKDLDREKFKKNKEKAKFLSGISTLFPKEDEILIKKLNLGLSIGVYNKLKDDLKKEYENKSFNYKIPSDKGTKEVKLHIEKVNVYPQGIAAYFDNVLDWEGEIIENDLLNERYFLVDVGGNSTDAFIAEGQNIIRQSPIALSNGMSDVFDNVINMVDKELSSLKIEKAVIDAEKENKSKIVVYDNFKEYDITNEFEEASNELAQYIYSQLMSNWDRIIGSEKKAVSCGGGALYIGKYLSGLYPESINHILLDDSQKANANGLFKLGIFEESMV